MKQLIWSLSWLVLLSSCIPNKKVLYLQAKENSTVQYDSLLVHNYPEYRLQVGDILNVEVRSSDPTVTQIFRPQGTGLNSAGQLANSAADVNYLTGFPINENGDVDLPLCGLVKVQGKTLTEAHDLIASYIDDYITDPYVLVKLGGIPYTAIGEFRQPGRYLVVKSQLTIFEALANAGDLRITANREKVTMIRQYSKGQKLHRIDLTDRDIMKSEFYYIQPNDQLYIEPLKVREIGAGVGVTSFQTFLQALSAVSTSLLIWVSITRL